MGQGSHQRGEGGREIAVAVGREFEEGAKEALNDGAKFGQ